MYGFEETQLHSVQVAVTHGYEEGQGEDSVQHYHEHRDDSNPKSELIQVNTGSNTILVDSNVDHK